MDGAIEGEDHGFGRKGLGALIAGTVALVGAVLTLLASRWQLSSKVDELTQTQFKDVLAKRIEVYPLLWHIPQTLLSDWEREGKQVDLVWAKTLLRRLMDWHADYGVFLSQGSYMTFDALRSATLQLVQKCEGGHVPTLADLQTLDRIYSVGDANTKNSDPLHVGLEGGLYPDSLLKINSEHDLPCSEVDHAI